MKTFSVCISRTYNDVMRIKAENAEEARITAWGMLYEVACGESEDEVFVVELSDEEE